MTSLFALSAGIILLGALAALLYPFVRDYREEDIENEAHVALPIYTRQLVDLQTDLDNNVLSQEAASTQRAEIARRMLAAEERERMAFKPPSAQNRVLWVAGLSAIIPVAATVIYLGVGRPEAILLPALPGTSTIAGTEPGAAHSPNELKEMASQLRAKLKQDPQDINNWVLLGRTLAQTEQYTEAKQAFQKAIELAPDEPILFAQLGEVMVLEAQDTVTDAAIAAFDKSGDDPRARYYLAVADIQHDRVKIGIDKLRNLLSSAPPNAPWRERVADTLRELGDDVPDAAPPPQSPLSMPPIAGNAKPSPEQIEAMQKMSPDERQAMIRSMVDRLAKKLDENPNDKAGWERLAGAYDVLGDKDKAEEARKRGRAIKDGAAPPTSPPSAASSAQKPPAASAAAPGPTREQMDAAASMSDGERTAMIRSMVERLAKKLDENPNDKAGWERLANAYTVMGDKEKAEEARKRAAALPPPGDEPKAADPQKPVGKSSSNAKPDPSKQKQLVARTQSSPTDMDGWIELSRYYNDTGDLPLALETLKRGTEANPRNIDLLMAYADGLATGIKGETLPNDFVEAMRKVNALDPEQSDALWYLGLDASNHNDRPRAAAYWTRLLGNLKDGSEERAFVQKRLEALK